MELPTKATKQIRKTDKDSRGVKDAKPGDMIFFVPRIHMVKEENQFPHVVPCPPPVHTK